MKHEGRFTRVKVRTSYVPVQANSRCQGHIGQQHTMKVKARLLIAGARPAVCSHMYMHSQHLSGASTRRTYSSHTSRSTTG